METGAEQLQPDKKWYSIVPDEEIPKEVDTWMIEIPDVGKLFVTLENKPGGTGYEDDDRAYALNTNVPGLAINGDELLDQGFKTLNIALTPTSQMNTQMAELGLKGTDISFESVLQRTDGNGPLKPLSYWVSANKTTEKPDMRDVMVRPERDQLEQIQISFPEGGDN